jgi:hypothetical protein
MFAVGIRLGRLLFMVENLFFKYGARSYIPYAARTAS